MNSNRQYKSEIYEQFSRIGKAVSSPQRHEILDLLCQGEQTVETLAHKANLTVANTSRHLQILKATRLVQSQKRGPFVVYRLADEAVCDFMRALRALAESHLAEVEQITRAFLTQKNQLERITQAEVIQRVQGGETLLLDVRPADEYMEGHIRGAWSIPLAELRQRIKDLPKDQQIVAYCRGPYCVLAVEAVQMLREHGFSAVRLEDGVSDWRARGFDVATGAQL